MKETMRDKVLLMILDGWGITPVGDEKYSAIAQAATPFMDTIWKEHPHIQLEAHGISVGLPENQMGNSEVGHITLGAGRVVYQDLVKINLSIEDRSLHKNKLLIDSLEYAKKEGKKVHFMGLLSDGGVHAHINHLKALCDIAHQQQVQQLYIHAFTDGRDTAPKSGIGFIEELQSHLKKTTGLLASIMGRFFAMDRGANWSRTSKAYRALVKGKAETYVEADKWKEVLKEKYDNNETDEFIEPVIIANNGKPVGTIEDGDVVFCYNFRTDRARQITEVLSQRDFPDYNMRKLKVHYLTMTRYDATYKDVSVLFESQNLRNTLGEILSKHGKNQIRIAESIKYPHVTYFFSGGREAKYEGEERILIQSPQVLRFDKKPEMSAEGIRDAILSKLADDDKDFVCLNIANADMVGHSGNMEATIKACEVVDSCTKSIVNVALKHGYVVIIVSDHGNADKLIDADGSPFTAHTKNPVPCIFLGYEGDLKLHNGKLSDIAPTILSLLDIDIPEEMTGKVLINLVEKE